MVQPAGAAAHAVERLSRFLRQLPRAEYAFAYGSGVHRQPGLYDDAPGSSSTAGLPVVAQPGHAASGSSSGSSGSSGKKQPSSGSSGSSGKKQPMIDFMLAVSDPEAWHQENLARNSSHYSWLGSLGNKAVTTVAEHVGVGVHFNTMVPIDGLGLVKYGVLSVPHLVDDLRTWRHLYAAGRLQKPVLELTSTPTAVSEAQAANLRSAAAAALLLLPPSFTTQELLTAVVGHSYRGDVRMAARAEDPDKLARIVAGSREGLEALYLPLLKQEFTTGPVLLQEQGHGATSGHSASGGSGGGSRWRREATRDAERSLLDALPTVVLQGMAARIGYPVPESHLEMPSTRAELLGRLTDSSRAPELARSTMEGIVGASSVYQAAAGLLAAGAGKAFQYTSEKLAKGLAGLQRAAGRSAGAGGPSAGGGGGATTKTKA